MQRLCVDLTGIFHFFSLQIDFTESKDLRLSLSGVGKCCGLCFLLWHLNKTLDTLSQRRAHTRPRAIQYKNSVLHKLSFNLCTVYPALLHLLRLLLHIHCLQENVVGNLVLRHHLFYLRGPFLVPLSNTESR